MRVLVVNAGSSSLKLSLVDGDRVTDSRTVQRWDGGLEPLEELLGAHPEVDAVGHRVVHGGPLYDGPVRLDEQVVAELQRLTSLAPLHQPRALAAVDAVGRLLPATPAVACFDTAFHRTLPAAAATYALPKEWNAQWGLRRYGFHGLSHAYASRRAAELVGRPLPELRVLTCHLGAGASLCAVRDGRSVDTTMGFTPLAGLVMATRSGSVDPGILMWLLRDERVTVAELDHALEHGSGLAGLSGTSGDLRDVLSRSAAGDPDSGLAYDVFVHRLARECAAMTASLGGLDLLVLTGGIGEHSPEVRQSLADRLQHLGVALDGPANANVAGDAEIGARDAAVRTVVVAAGEDREVAREVVGLLQPSR